MSVKLILAEMLTLLRTQIEAVVAGDAQAVQAGADRHEQLLGALPDAEPSEPAEELRPLYEQINYEKTRLMSLLTSESARADFLLRLILGGGGARPAGYPGGAGQTQDGARIINRRT